MTKDEGPPDDEPMDLGHADCGVCDEARARKPRDEGPPDPRDAARDRLWCEALLPEGTDVIERVTRRFLAGRVALPPPGSPPEENPMEWDENFNAVGGSFAATDTERCVEAIRTVETARQAVAGFRLDDPERRRQIVVAVLRAAALSGGLSSAEWRRAMDGAAKADRQIQGIAAALSGGSPPEPRRRRLALCRRADAEPGAPYDFIADWDCAACQQQLELVESALLRVSAAPPSEPPTDAEVDSWPAGVRQLWGTLHAGLDRLPENTPGLDAAYDAIAAICRAGELREAAREYVTLHSNSTKPFRIWAERFAAALARLDGGGQ